MTGRGLMTGVMLMALAAPPAAAAETVRATLEAHALLPAATFTVAPADAPAGLQVSGRWIDPSLRRLERIGALAVVNTTTAPAPVETGYTAPMVGQPVQGFSGIRSLGADRFLVLSDNGFGSKANSPDAMLMVHELAVDWSSGRVTVERTIFLRDPDRVIPYRITNEHTAERYLTGADLDPESIQPVPGGYWIGDEFGPFLVEIDRDGTVRRFVETVVDGKPVRSPDHPTLQPPAAPGPLAFEARRSRGYEGMALAPDGARLYPMLEGPLFVGEPPAPESIDGRAVLRILELDPATGALAPTTRFYPLDQPGHAIGDFNMIDATRALVIERDGNEGDPRRACAAGQDRDCFAAPAAYKRIWLVDLGQVDARGVIRKIASVDLLDIADPDGRARRGSIDGVFTFPFVTIENVDVVDERRIVVGNDNNFPFSIGRTPGRADDNELVLLDVADLLSRR